MSGVDLSKIKPGDVVTVRGEVEFIRPQADDSRNFGVRFPHAGESGRTVHYIKASAIVSHTPKALSVGDRVKHRLREVIGVVAATDGEFAWVNFGLGYDGRRGDNTYDTCLLCNLERV